MLDVSSIIVEKSSQRQKVAKTTRRKEASEQLNLLSLMNHEFDLLTSITPAQGVPPRCDKRRRKRRLMTPPVGAIPESSRLALDSRKDWIIGRSNKEATIKVRSWFTGKGKDSSLFLVGPCGVGKSHLLLAEWQELKQKKDWCFANDSLAIAELLNRPFHSLKDKKGIILDGLVWKILSSKEEVRLGEFIDFCQLHNVRILFSSHEKIGQYQNMDGRTQGRLKSLTQVEIYSWDKGISERLMDGLLPPHHQSLKNDFLNFGTFNNAFELKEFMHQLDSQALSLNQEDDDYWQKWFTRTISKGKRAAPNNEENMEEVLNLLSDYGRFSKDDILGRRRLAPLALIRQVLMYWLNRHFDHSLGAIGRYLQRDHSTILHGVRRIEQLMHYDQEVIHLIEFLQGKESQ